MLGATKIFISQFLEEMCLLLKIALTFKNPNKLKLYFD